MKTKSTTPRRTRARAAKFSPERLRWLNQQLIAIAPTCPWTKRNPAECPLHGVRKLPTSAIAEWLDRLSAEEKEYLVLYHQCCLAIKWENETMGPGRPKQTGGVKRQPV
jgi:hypothetical protein